MELKIIKPPKRSATKNNNIETICLKGFRMSKFRRSRSVIILNKEIFQRSVSVILKILDTLT